MLVFKEEKKKKKKQFSKYFVVKFWDKMFYLYGAKEILKKYCFEKHIKKWAHKIVTLRNPGTPLH